MKKESWKWRIKREPNEKAFVRAVEAKVWRGERWGGEERTPEKINTKNAVLPKILYGVFLSPLLPTPIPTVRPGFCVRFYGISKDRWWKCWFGTRSCSVFGVSEISFLNYCTSKGMRESRKGWFTRFFYLFFFYFQRNENFPLVWWKQFFFSNSVLFVLNKSKRVLYLLNK